MYKENSNTEYIEKTLETYYQAASPSNEFLERLEIQLNQAEKEMGVAKLNQGFFDTLFNSLFKEQKTSWVYAPATIALLVIVVVFAIGPSRALATVQGWLRYVPGC